MAIDQEGASAQSALEMGPWRRAQQFCAIAGALIGASDGAATAVSAILYRNPAYVGAERLSVVGFWALGAFGVGAIVAVLLRVPIYYGIFGGNASAKEFTNVAVISLVGGVAVCLATGTFAFELSWLATPLITFGAAITFARRRVSSTRS